MPRNFSLIDQIIGNVDAALRTLWATPRVCARPRPDQDLDRDDAEPLSDVEQARSSRLLRVDHCGEVCAQALYHGQALVARDPAIAARLEQSAEEENDHLGWCETRLAEMNSRPSLLSPVWYAGSFMIGVVAGLISDKVSLGFVVETEAQVIAHLDDHLQRLPAQDYKSRVILEKMRSDEAEHAAHAEAAGAAELPFGVKTLMRATAKVMTTVAYWV